MINISSAENPLVKEVKSLSTKKGREKTGKFFVEGLKFVKEALEYPSDICYIMVSEKFFSSYFDSIINTAEERGIKIYKLIDSLFEKLTDTETPQGILCVLKKLKFDMQEILKKQNKFFILVDNVQDPGNFGTIIRTADAFGVDLILATKGTVDVYNPKVVRSTMGSIFRVPVIYEEDMVSCIKRLKGEGFKIMSASLDGRSILDRVDLDGNIAVILGNESRGVRKEFLGESDELVKIPMVGKAESLNVSIASGIIMYEVMKYRLQKKMGMI